MAIKRYKEYIPLQKLSTKLKVETQQTSKWTNKSVSVRCIGTSKIFLIGPNLQCISATDIKAKLLIRGLD